MSEHWTEAPLGQLADLCLGKMLDKAKNRGTPRPYLRNINVRWGSFDLSDVKEMPFEDHEAERYSVRNGDVVICEGGEPGRCAVWRRNEPYFIQKALHRVRCDSDLVPAFLAYQLQLFAMDGTLQESFTGSTIKHLPGAVLAKLPVRFPNPGEQARIVAEIEKQFTRLDDAVATLEKVQVKLQAARASVLKAAVEGRLVPTAAEMARAEGRSYEPADVLLERILAERQTKAGKGKYKPPVEPDTEGLPELPEGWVWASLDQASSLVRNGYSKKPDDNGSTPILRISAVRPCSVDRQDCRWLAAPISDLPEATAFPGDLLFTRYNGTRSLVGVCGLLRGEGPVVHPDKLIRVVLSAQLDSGYIEAAANAGASRRFLEARIRTTAGQSGVSGGDIKQVPIPLPPRTEQARIVAEVERRLSVLDSLGQTVETNLRRLTRLRQSILKRAFEGKLVPQNPNDEPASELVARIQAGA